MQRQDVVRRVGKVQQPLLWQTDYIAAEQNLETIGFFSARYTRPSLREEKNLSKVITLSDGRQIEIVPAAKYGFPNAEDLDYYRAFLKICDERAELITVHDNGRLTFHPRLPSPIGFSTRELITKAGKIKNGRGHIAVRNWIERMSSTTIHGALFNAKLRKYDVRIGLEPVFRQYVHVGRPMGDGEPAAQNYVWLSSWFIENYFHLYARRVDLLFHHRLSHAISKTLYPLLDTGWYAASGGPYTKRYDDLCVVLGIKAYQQISKVRYQLDPSNEELLNSQFVGRYDYPLDEQGEWTRTVRWWPGPKWLYDQSAKRQKRGSEAIPSSVTSQLQIDKEADSLQIPLPLQHGNETEVYTRCVREFYEKLGQSRPSREKMQMGVSVVRNLIEEQSYSIEELQFTFAWIIKNLATRFEGRVQSFGIVPHVIGEALQERTTIIKKQEQTVNRVREEQQGRARDREIQKLVEKLDELPYEERERFQKTAIKSLTDQGFQRQFLLDSLVKIEMARLYEQEVDGAARGPS